MGPRQKFCPYWISTPYFLTDALTIVQCKYILVVWVFSSPLLSHQSSKSLKKNPLLPNPSRDYVSHYVPDHMNEMSYMSELENFPILIAESLSCCWASYKSKVSINYGTRNAIVRRSSPVYSRVCVSDLLRQNDSACDEF